jgi:hypothetical protein
MTMACFASPHYLGCPVHIDRTRARAENQVSEQARSTAPRRKSGIEVGQAVIDPPDA